LVTTLVGDDLVAEGCSVTPVVMVCMTAPPVAVVERLPRMVDETMVEDGTETGVLLVTTTTVVEVACAEPDAEPEADEVDAAEVLPPGLPVLVLPALPPVEVELPLPVLLPLPPVMWKGLPHWKMFVLDSSVIWMPYVARLPSVEATFQS
jgi:hypothetical protein